jgi:hypothetical protein
MSQLGGRWSPVVYLRTADWVEPYTDHGRVGRLVLLRPQAIEPWRSGAEHVYVAPRGLPWRAAAVAFVPGAAPTARLQAEAAHLRRPEEVRETLGGRAYDEAVAGTRARIASLTASHARSERIAGPLRERLQSGGPTARDAARRALAAAGITEEDLCAAWHHLSDDRRAHLAGALQAMDPAAWGGP